MRNKLGTNFAEHTSRLHHETAQHLQIGNQQFGLRAQLMPHTVQLRLQYLVKSFREAVFNGDLLHVHVAIDAFDLFDNEVHDFQQMRLDHGHPGGHRDVQFDDDRFVCLERVTNERMEPRPYEQILDEHILHDSLDVAVAIGECLGTAAERLHEARFILLAMQSQRERLLARFDDLMGTQHNDAGDQMHWDSMAQQVDHQNARRNEMDAAE